MKKDLEEKECPSQEQVVADRKLRFRNPALPANKERDSAKCVCKGMCATKKCDCRGSDVMCDTRCKCNVDKCKNRE